MSLSGAIKSFLGVGEAKTEDSKKETQIRTAADPATGKIGTMLLTGQISETEAHSGQNGQQTNTGAGDTYTAAPVKDVEIDVKKMAKTYKKNPLEALKDATIGRTYSAEEAEELKELLQDKDDLQNYFELAKKGTLSNKDIIAGLKELTANKTSYLWGLIKGNKLDEEKFASNMSRVRKIRKEFTSNGVAHISKVITKNEEFTDTAVHMMSKRDTYNEENVIEGVDYMEENPKNAEAFFNNMVEMEEIRKDNGAIKYKGDTILKVTKARTSNAQISTALIKAAKRTDMNDESLTKITDNVESTPQMAKAMEDFIDKKNSKGEFTFNAKNLEDQSSYLVGKSTKTIESYRKNTLELAGYDKMLGDAIVECAQRVTDYPQTLEDVMTAAADKNISCEEVVTISKSLTNPAEAYNTQKATANSAATNNFATEKESIATASEAKYVQNSANYLQTAEPQELRTSQAMTAPMNTETTARKDITRVFGNESDFEYVAEQVKKAPELKPIIAKLYFNPNMPANKIAGLIKQYSTQELEVYANDPIYFEQNPQMLKLYIKNKSFFDKLSLYGVPAKQKEQLAAFASGPSKELLFEMLDNGISADKVLSYLTTAKQENKENELKTLVTDATINSAERLAKLRNKDFTKTTV